MENYPKVIVIDSEDEAPPHTSKEDNIVQSQEFLSSTVSSVSSTRLHSTKRLHQTLHNIYERANTKLFGGKLRKDVKFMIGPQQCKRLRPGSRWICLREREVFTPMIRDLLRVMEQEYSELLAKVLRKKVTRYILNVRSQFLPPEDQ